jgi:hypothetical protein
MNTSPRLRFIIVLIGEVVLAWAMWRQVTRISPDYRLNSDLARYFAIVNHGGTPYRDFAVEYPPGALAIFWVLGRASFDAFVRQMLLVNFVCEALIVGMVYKGWGSRTAWSYVLLSTPMLIIVYPRFDLFAVSIAVLGALLVARRYATAGGIAWVVSALVKPMPVVLIPALAARRQPRAFFTAIALGAISVLAWVIWAGRQGPRQVLTYRNAKGWEIQSVPGSLLRLFTRHAVRFESGSWRLGAPPGVFTAFFAACLVAVVVITWWFYAHHTVADGVAEVVVLTAMLTFSTLFSPQFVVWILPWAAIAAGSGVLRIERWAAAVVVLTFIAWALFDVNHAARLSTELAVIARNVALIGLLIVATIELRSSAAVPARPLAERGPVGAAD